MHRYCDFIYKTLKIPQRKLLELISKSSRRYKVKIKKSLSFLYTWTILKGNYENPIYNSIKKNKYFGINQGDERLVKLKL